MDRRQRATLFNAEQNYDYGVVGRIPTGSRMWSTLDTLSDHDYSRWRQYTETLQIQRQHPERSYAFCFSCRYAGPTDPSDRHRCPRCKDIVAA